MIKKMYPKTVIFVPSYLIHILENNVTQVSEVETLVRFSIKKKKETMSQVFFPFTN